MSLVWKEPSLSPNNNDRILNTDDEDFFKLCNVEVLPQWELLIAQNLYDIKLSPTNLLGKLFLSTSFVFSNFC